MTAEVTYSKVIIIPDEKGALVYVCGGKKSNYRSVCKHVSVGS